MEDDSFESWPSGDTGRRCGRDVEDTCYDWENNNRNMNFLNCCSECGATTWNTCICLRSADPEDEESVTLAPAQRVGTGAEKVFATNEHQDGAAATTQQANVQESRASSERSSAAHQQQTTEETDVPKHIIDYLNKLHADLDSIRKDKKTLKQNLAESCLTFLHELKSFRKKMTDHMDKLEKKAKSELNSLYEKLEEALQNDIDMCERTQEELNKASETLETDDVKPSDNLHACMDIIESKLAVAREVIKDLSKSDTSGKFNFVFHPTLQSVSSNIKSLGRFVFKQQVPVPEETQDVIEVSDVNIRHSSDKKSCCISGICQLEDGQILLVDRDNKNLKCLDKEYKITHCCELNAAPRGLCNIGSNKAAVALSNDSVQFVHAAGEPTLAQSLLLGHQCWGIACLGDKLYISDWATNVYIYDLSGNPIKTVSKDQLGRKIFTNSRHIAVNGKANLVYVCDRVKGLVVIDEIGRVLSESSHPDLKMPHGVCTDECGNVFLSGSLSQNIVLHLQKQTNEESKGDNSHWKGQKQKSKGDKTRTIVKTGGVTYPGALWFDNKRSKLLVATCPPFGGCDTMRVLSLP